MRIPILALAIVLLAMAPVAASGVGFERATVADSDGTPREVGIWYPSDAPASPQPLGPHRQTVALGGPVAGRQLPLVVILHGVQGTFDNHYHTALALAEAGFVVAGVTHTLGFTFSAQALVPIKAPVQLWRAGNDEITPHPRHAEAVYQALATKPEYHVVPDAGHFVFIACSGEMARRAPAICGDAPAFDRVAFHQKFNAAVVNFFRTQLR